MDSFEFMSDSDSPSLTAMLPVWSFPGNLDSNLSDFASRCQALQECNSMRSFTFWASIADYVVEPLFSEDSPLIGTGGASAVSLERNPVTGRPVAVKLLRAFPFPDEPQFFFEVEALVNLNHPCILRIVGFALPGEFTDAEIHTEYAENGSLAKILARARRGGVPSFWNPTGKSIIICGVVLGMICVHSLNYIHCDLRPSKVMINGTGRALIGGFSVGCSEGSDETRTFDEGSRGDVRYTAPEIYGVNPCYTSKADVYSFGLVLYEMLVGSPVFDPRDRPHQVLGQIVTGNFPAVPDECGRFMQQLIARCWSMDPKARPSFRDILDEFRDNDFALLPGANATAIREYVYGVLLWESRHSRNRDAR
jgi:serine/threonine protein kinase